jgi:hypothetical protein
MSREVPMDQPLSDEDREYLHARGQHQTVEMLDERFPADDAEEEGDDYDEWTVDELKSALAERQLPTTGKKPELVERLRGAPREAL